MNGTKQVADRITIAREWFVELMGDNGVDRETALKAIPALVKAKLMKLDPVMGRFTFKSHLACDVTVVRNAAAA